MGGRVRATQDPVSTRWDHSTTIGTSDTKQKTLKTNHSLTRESFGREIQGEPVSNRRTLDRGPLISEGLRPDEEVDLSRKGAFGSFVPN